MANEIKLDPCPFCGGEVEVVVCDDEGNIHSEEYECDPWSGLSYGLRHMADRNANCPIAEGWDDLLGCYLYDTREEAVAAWNRRAGKEVAQ